MLGLGVREPAVLRSQWPGMEGDITTKSLPHFAEKVMPKFA
ncbi:MAG: hypothetical protein O2913_00285 [Chloroflexi bacterium]|nr:hypothetical protein [Chloroflexota bacterium]